MFKTAQGQTTSVPDIARKIFEIIMSDKTNSYEITVGTDSQNFDRTKMVEVIAIHKKGMGGTYLQHRVHSSDHQPQPEDQRRDEP